MGHVQAAVLFIWGEAAEIAGILSQWDNLKHN